MSALTPPDVPDGWEFHPNRVRPGYETEKQLRAMLEPGYQRTTWYKPVTQIERKGRCGPTHKGTWNRDEFIEALARLPPHVLIEFSYCEGYDENWGFYSKRSLTEEELSEILLALSEKEAQAQASDRQHFEALLAKHPEWKRAS